MEGCWAPCETSEGAALYPDSDALHKVYPRTRTRRVLSSVLEPFLPSPRRDAGIQVFLPFLGFHSMAWKTVSSKTIVGLLERGSGLCPISYL